MSGAYFAVAIFALICALIPAVLFLINLFLYTPPGPVPAGAQLPAVSILIPARNEAHAILDAVHAALATTGIDFEVIVMDDSSTDGTDDLVRTLAAADPRVRLEQAPSLPGGWNGKQHACWSLAHTARNPLLCFVDADVRLSPECVARMAARIAGAEQPALISGFPRQITGTTLEWLLLPLIHFVLLGFLPVARMRESAAPSLAAGCGQFMMARKEAYFQVGGHNGIRLTMHDGLRLPRLFREHGLRTDLADITDLATCRMYTSAAQVWSGLAKNATEGIADPARIVPISLVLFAGQVLPFLVLLPIVLGVVLTTTCGVWLGSHGLDIQVSNAPQARILTILLASAMIAAWTPRILAVTRFKQDWRSALLHPVGIFLLLCVQWYSLSRKLMGGQVSWKDRAYVGE